MPYLNTATSTFGHSVYDVRAANPGHSIPDGCDCGSFLWYAETNRPDATIDEVVTELEPVRVNGVLTQQWALTPLTGDALAAAIASAKQAKNAEINEARLAANRSTFQHAGKTFACDELSRSDIDGTNGFVTLNGALPPSWPGGWKAVDNTYLAITTVAEWKAFYGAMFAAGSANFAKAQALKASLANAALLSEVAAIRW